MQVETPGSSTSVVFIVRAWMLNTEPEVWGYFCFYLPLMPHQRGFVQHQSA